MTLSAFQHLAMPPPAVFDPWESKPVVLPPRSRLYALKPIGIGTPYVESLTGYVIRLADAHAVSVGDLLGREVSTAALKPLLSFGPFMRRNRAQSHGFHAQPYAVNGFGERSKTWVDALGRATSRTDLRFLTLLPWEGLFSRAALFRHTHAWCPDCYERWRVGGDVVYEPLLWAMAPVKVCPLHRRSLEETCPHCHGRLMPIAVYSRPGCCSRCQRWLGNSTESRSSERSTLSDKENDAALWQAEAIAELFAATLRLSSPFLSSMFRSNFQACVDAAAEGNQRAFAQAARVSCYTVECRLLGKNLPQINTLLRICYHLQIPLTAFVENDLSRTAVFWERAKESVQTGRKLPLSRTAGHVRYLLERAALEQPSPSLAEIARRLSYRGVERLYQVAPELCKRIAANYRRSGRSHWWRRSGATRICERTAIRRLLEQSLAEERPISTHHIAAGLGYANDGYIRQRFPDLSRAISQKIAAQKIARLASLKSTLDDALRESSVPNLNRLTKRVGFASSDTLWNHFPDLCRQIKIRQRVARQRRITELRRTLQAALRESPAPSFTGVCRRIGLSPPYLKDILPRQCAALQSRYLCGRREASQRRRDQMVEEVRQIVRKLHHQGKCPSVTRVWGLLGETTLREWKALDAAVKSARQELAPQQ